MSDNKNKNVQIFELDNGVNEKHIGYSFSQLQQILNIEGINQYIAGFFDGEGYVRIGKNIGKYENYQLEMGLVNTDLDILKKIQSYFGCGKFNIIDNKRNKSHKVAYILRFHSWNALKVLKIIEPYLIIKKERTNIAIEFQRRFEDTGKGVSLSNKERQLRETYYYKMKALNKKGSDIDDDIEIDLKNEINKINDSNKNTEQPTLFDY